MAVIASSDEGGGCDKVADGGREKNVTIQQIQYPSCKKPAKKHDTLGTQALV